MRKNKGASQRQIFGVFDLGRVAVLDGETGKPVAAQEPEPTTLQGWLNRDEQRKQSRLAAEQKVRDDARHESSTTKRSPHFIASPSETLSGVSECVTTSQEWKSQRRTRKPERLFWLH